MTSDRGTEDSQAEMKLDSTPVTPKTTGGLNPNAHVFESKGVSSPPGGLEWQLTPESPLGEETDNVTATLITDPNLSPLPSEPVFSLMNGDEGKVPNSMFPPSPESPGTFNGYETNGLLPSEPYASSEPPDDQIIIPEGPEGEEQLRELLKTQLEYYFSRENLANDTYLVSQMDADQYVPITTVANFNQVKRLTTDMHLVIQVLRESGNVQVDEKGEKVRPLHKRCVVILREVPETTPVEDVERLFGGENCPKFVSCEFAHNNNWYVTFNSDEDAQRAYQYLREEVKTFQGKPIMARIKAKPLLHSTFLPKNGYKQQYSGGSSGSTTPQATTEASQVFNQQRFTTFPQVPTTQYIISQQGYPFFPPNTVVQAPWPPAASPMTFFDPGTAFTVNGYTPATTYKLSGTSSRHGFQNSRNRNQKPHRGGGQEREHHRVEHRERGGREWAEHSEHAVPVSRSSRHTPTSHSFTATATASVSAVSTQDTNSINGTAQTTTTAPTTVVASSASRQISDSKDSLPRRNYRSRRRGPTETDPPKTSRHNTGTVSASKDSKTPPTPEMPKFDLETTSFPPLPGATPAASAPKATTGSAETSIWENKMSDVVKGTVKPSSKPAVVTSTTPVTTSTTTAAVVAPASIAAIANTTTSSAKKEEKEQVLAKTSSKTTEPVKEETKENREHKETKKSVAVSTATSTPSQPSSPASPVKVSKWTSTEKSSPPSTTSTTTQTTLSQPNSHVSNASVGSQAVMSTVTTTASSTAICASKLSYAQMVAKSREAAERREAEEREKGEAVANGPSKDKPAALRDQSQVKTSKTSPQDSHKDNRLDEYSRPNGRRSKENRRGAPLDRDRFRDRRRDNDTRPAYSTK